jgi:hypothetical protein
MTELKAIRPPAQNINDRRADTTTPMAEPKAPRPIIVLSTTVAYRGRVITISNEGYRSRPLRSCSSRPTAPA